MTSRDKRWKLHKHASPFNGLTQVYIIGRNLSGDTRSLRIVFLPVTAESDICTFATRTEHFHVTNKASTGLFTPGTRPKALKELYELAAIVAVRSLDSLRRDGSSMDMFLCTPVLGKRRRDQSLDIESRVVSTFLSQSLDMKMSRHSSHSYSYFFLLKLVVENVKRLPTVVNLSNIASCIGRQSGRSLGKNYKL